MTNIPLVSVALCTYNGARFLEQQLDTLVNQTYSNIEIVAVDDCSSDNTFQILTKYASKYSNLKLYKNEVNIGFVNNFERALDYCNGEFIAFCDQDDLWDLNKIKFQVEAIADNMILYHDSELINEKNESLHTKMSDLFNFYRGDEPEAFLFFNCISGHAMLIKRELLNEARPFKKDAYHDWWMAYVATNIGTIDYLPQCLVKYRQHDDSDTDLLARKEIEKDPYRHQTATQIFIRRTKWLQHCAAYPKNKRQHFIKTLLYLYKNRPNSYFSFRLAFLMEKYVGILYYIQKRDKYKKHEEVLKLAWGYKAKNFWYTYIKPKRNKKFYIDQ